jgi:hypothetical protein
MAAVDLFESVVAELSEKERTMLADSLRSWRTDLLAARSEDARVRLVSDFIQEIRTLTGSARPALQR